MPDQSYPRSAVDLFDDEALLPSSPTPLAGLRLPDGRTLAWAEYGNSRGLPCLLIPDFGSSRLAPGWLLHDAAVPAGIRLLAVDRPGVGASEPVGIGGRETPADDLIRMVQTLAVGRLAVIGIGRGVDDALALAERFPGVVTGVAGISPQISDATERRGLRNRFGGHRPWDGPLMSWARAAGRADLAREGTWRYAWDRMEPAAQEALGERWRESDFRLAVAADLELSQSERSQRLPRPTPGWVTDWTAETPVRLWHGRHEWSTHVSALRAVTHGRAHWEVSTVSDCSALLGAWPDIFRWAEETFRITPYVDSFNALSGV